MARQESAGNATQMATLARVMTAMTMTAKAGILIRHGGTLLHLLHMQQNTQSIQGLLKVVDGTRTARASGNDEAPNVVGKGKLRDEARARTRAAESLIGIAEPLSH